MTSMPRIADEPSDAEMITAARAGDLDAFGVLYGRHVGAAERLARQLAQSGAEVDDLVAEAFAKVLGSLRAGGGPDLAFRAYLLTTLRNIRYDRMRRERRLEYSADLTDVDPGVPFVDTALQELESTLVSRAFASLPERWQNVLWSTEVERQTPAQVAAQLGLTPNGVSALAYRAREGLRQAYLQVHLRDSPGKGCRGTVQRLGAWARHGLSRRDTAQVDTHLADCVRCRQLAAELADINHGLRGVVAALVLGGPAVAGYLAAAEAALPAVAAGSAVGAVAAGTATSGSAATGLAVAGTAVSGAAGAAGGGLAAGAATSASGPAAGTALGYLAGLLPASGLAKLAVGVGTVLVAGSLAVALPHPPAQKLLALPPPVHPATSQPAAPGGGPAANPPGGAAERGADRGSPGRSGQPDKPAGQPGQPGVGGGAASGLGGADATLSGSLTAGDPVSAGPATPEKGLTAGRTGKLDIPVHNSGNRSVPNLVATIALPAGVTLNDSSGPPDADAALPKAKKWQCTATTGGASCRLDQLAPGTTTLELKVTVAADSRGGPLTGQIESESATTVQIQPSQLVVAPQ